MRYIHIRNLQKYHPGYKDRMLQWAKIYFKVAQGDPDCEMITDEIDWGRLVRLILLELQAQKPIPLDEAYLAKKGFDLKKRPISLTLQMLQNFIEVIQSESEICVLDKDKDKDKEKIVEAVTTPPDFIASLKTNPAYTGIDIDRELAKMDAWLLTRPHRKKTQRFIVNWLNKVDRVVAPQPKQPTARRQL